MMDLPKFKAGDCGWWNWAHESIRTVVVTDVYWNKDKGFEYAVGPKLFKDKDLYTSFEEAKNSMEGKDDTV